MSNYHDSKKKLQPIAFEIRVAGWRTIEKNQHMAQRAFERTQVVSEFSLSDAFKTVVKRTQNMGAVKSITISPIYENMQEFYSE